MSKKESKQKREPLSDTKIYCMDIDSNKSVGKDKHKIIHFARDLISNSKYNDSFSPEEFYVGLDTIEKRVCIELKSSAKKTKLRMEDLISQITPKDLKISSTIRFKKPRPFVLESYLKKEKKEMLPGIYWITLAHNGPYLDG